MADTFDCPKCGALINFQAEVQGYQKTSRVPEV
jgi:hypothetical protein